MFSSKIISEHIKTFGKLYSTYNKLFVKAAAVQNPPRIYCITLLSGGGFTKDALLEIKNNIVTGYCASCTQFD